MYEEINTRFHLNNELGIKWACSMDFNTTINNLKTKLQILAGKIKTCKLPDKSALKTDKIIACTSNFAKHGFSAIGKYSYEHENILGLEISPHYIRICQMKNSYGRWSLNQLASACMESQFTLRDIQSNPEIYTENLKILIAKHHIKAKEVALSIPTSSSIIKIINIPDMEEDELAQAAGMGGIWESLVELNGGIHEYSVYYKILNRKIKPSCSLAERTIHESQDIYLESKNETTAEPAITSFNLENLLQVETAPLVEEQLQEDPNITATTTETQDGTIAADETSTIQEEAPQEASIEEAEEEANTMDVLFVAAKIMDIQLYLDIVKKAGLIPIIADVKCNALKHAFETNPERDKTPGPYALLEFGADENYIYIINGAQTIIFNINITDHDRDLVAQNETNQSAVSGFVQRYAGQLQEILDEYTKKYNNKIYNIYVSSATPLHVDKAASEPLINMFINNITQIMGDYKISQCTFCNHIEVPAEFAKKVNAEGNLAAWATVLGLATYKLDVFDYNKKCDVIDRVNLLPGAEIQKKSRVLQLLSALVVSAVFAFVVTTSVLTFLLLIINSNSLSSQINGLASVKNEYETKNNEMQKLKNVMDKVKSLDSVKDTLPSNQAQVIGVYKHITQSIPEGVWLSEINFSLPKFAEIRGNSINDQNILEFIKRLNESGGFKKVSLKTMEVVDKGDTKTTTSPAVGTYNVKRFAIQCELMLDAAATKLEIISSGVK